MRKVYVVRLPKGEREQLTQIVKKFKGTSQKVRRAQILLKADADGPGWTDQQIADAFGCPKNGGCHVDVTFSALRQYDQMNRVVEVSHLLQDNTPDELVDNVLLSRFSYSRFANGRPSAEHAVLDDGSIVDTYWTIDALGRLLSEDRQSTTGIGDYITEYTLDLLGNRSEVATDLGRDGTVDRWTGYTYDAEQRLLSSHTTGAGAEGERYTEYQWSGTEQTGVSVFQGGDSSAAVLETTRNAYDVHGRLASRERALDGGTTTTEFEYGYGLLGAKGRRVRETITTETAEGATSHSLAFLYDPLNPSGLPQVLEIRTDAELTTSFVLGHNIVAQIGLQEGGPGSISDPWQVLRRVGRDGWPMVRMGRR